MKLRDLLEDKCFVRSECVVVRETHDEAELDEANWEKYDWFDLDDLYANGYAPVDSYEANYDSDVLHLDSSYTIDGLAMIVIVVE